MTPRLKQWIGILLFDTWRYEKSFFSKGDNWLKICNRNETLTVASQGKGVKCNWNGSTQLHAPKFISSWGKRLLGLALDSYPISLEDNNLENAQSENPEVSFIIGHRGLERLPLLLMTLRSISSQNCSSIECIVVEDSYQPVIKGKLPPWVKYAHIPSESPHVGYNRSKMFNAGAVMARGRKLIFHDNDMLVPTVYVNELLNRFSEGYQVVQLKRFIFYLTASHTEQIITSKHIDTQSPDFILQNLTGGGSVAVEKKSFYEIGGFDEGFVGWGGEDEDFWERANTLNVFAYPYLPLIHLWHQPQSDKTSAKDSEAMNRWRYLSTIDVNERIKALTS